MLAGITLAKASSKRADTQRRALEAYVKLTRATDSVVARVSTVVTEAGLTYTQFTVLEALLHLGALCQRDIAEKIMKSTGNITMVVNNLEKQGLVERKRGNGSRRLVTVCLTPKGDKLIRKLFPSFADAVEQEFSVLNRAETESFSASCRKLGLVRN